MTVRELAPQHPEHEQKAEQHNNNGNNGDHAFKNIAADVWKPGITAKEESGKIEAADESKDKFAKEIVGKNAKDPAEQKLEHEIAEAIKALRLDHSDKVEDFEKMAKQHEHGHHGDKAILRKVSAGGEEVKPLGGDVVEKFTGTDGKMHTYTPLNIEKFMPKQFEDLQKV